MLRRELGLDPGAPFELLRLDGAGDFAGWTARFWGIRLDEPRWPKGAHVYYQIVKWPPSHIWVGLLRAEVRQGEPRFRGGELVEYEDGPVGLRADWRWGETVDEQFTLCGLKRRGRGVDIAPLRPAFDILAGQRRGRPPGSVSVPDFPKRMPAVYRELRETLGKRPTQYEVADALGIDRRTLRRYLNQCGIDWCHFD